MPVLRQKEFGLARAAIYLESWIDGSLVRTPLLDLSEPFDCTRVFHFFQLDAKSTEGHQILAKLRCKDATSTQFWPKPESFGHVFQDLWALLFYFWFNCIVSAWSVNSLYTSWCRTTTFDILPNALAFLAPVLSDCVFHTCNAVHSKLQHKSGLKAFHGRKHWNLPGEQLRKLTRPRVSPREKVKTKAKVVVLCQRQKVVERVDGCNYCVFELPLTTERHVANITPHLHFNRFSNCVLKFGLSIMNVPSPGQSRVQKICM